MNQFEVRQYQGLFMFMCLHTTNIINVIFLYVMYSAEVLLKCWHSVMFCHPSLETNDVAVKWEGRRNEGVFLQRIFLFAEC